MEDNKTKEVVSAEQYRKDSLYGRLYDSTHFDVTDTIDIMLEEYAVMRVEQSTKHLQDRIVELTKVLDTCDKTFELLNQIVFNLKAAADGDNLKDMVEAVDIDFPLIQAKIKDTFLNTKS